MDIKSFKDLRVWQHGVELVVCIYQLTGDFPKQETYGLASQMQRAAVSIPSNIAEGHTREHSKEYLNHLSIAQGSLAELQTHIEISGRLGYISEEESARLNDTSRILSKQIYSLRNAVAVLLTPSPQPPTPCEL